MADEIVNTLGFNVDEALAALQRLDAALQGAGSAFGNFGAALDSFNSRASAALATMRNLASAATRLSTAMQNAPAGTEPSTASAAAPSPQPSLPPSAQQAAQAMAAVGTAAQQAGQQASRAMQQAGQSTQQAASHAAKFVVSWETISRVVMTQAIVRALSMIRDSLKEAVSAAEEFQVRLAEIQTIAPRVGGDIATGVLGAGESLKTLQSETAEFAKSFNVPLPQVTEGLYQAISNQFTSVTDRSNVMNAAMKLSKVGVMDFQQAILLLTGTLNAYGMTSDAAEATAMKFCEAIRLGRVRGKELADTMGQVIPIAAELGIGLNEVNAAMVALTIGGLDAHKSVTALRGVMTAFLKPSEDMKKVVREMGFSDPEQLIAARGFQGALQAISTAADGMGSEVAKSVRNVRALTAELRLTTDEGARQYQEALKAMEAATPENLDKILKEFRSTDAEKLTSQVNALKVNLTQDFGQAIVAVLGSVMELMGGADKLAAAITALAAAAVPCAVALTGLAVGLGLVHLSLGPVGVALAALTLGLAAGVGTYTYLTMQNVANIRKEAEERRQATLEALRDEDMKIAKWKEAQEATAKRQQGAWESDTASIRRDYFSALDELKVKNQEAAASARGVMESMIAAQDRVVAAYRNAANAAAKAVQESQQRQATLVAGYADARFRYAQRDLDAETKADNYRARSLQLARQAAEALASAKTPDEIQEASAAFARADAHAKEAESIAGSVRNVQLQEDVERSVLAIVRMKIDAEQRLQQVQAAQAETLAQQAAAEQGRVNEMKELMQVILKDLQAFGSRGARDPMRLEEQGKRLTENVARFQELFMGGQKVDVADLLHMDQLQRRVALAIEGGVDQVQIREFFADPGAFSKLRKSITDGLGPVGVLIQESVKYDPAMAREIKGMSAEEAVNHLSMRLSQARQQTIDFGAAEKRLDEAQNGLDQFAQNAQQALGRWSQLTQDLDIGATGAFQLLLAPNSDWSESVKAATAEVKAQAAKFTAKGAVVTDKDFLELEAAFAQYQEVIKPSAETKEAYEQFVRDAKTVLEQSKKVQAAAEAVDFTKTQATEAAQRVPDIENALKAAKDAAEQAKRATDATYQGAQWTGAALDEVAQTDMTGLKTQIDNATTAMWGLVAAANAFVPPDASGMTAAHGGTAWKHLASGGPVGTDVVPAVLSPGEVVINAASARKFASELTAINAGVRPVYRSDGGSVTNIGDVSITVNESKTPDQTAKSVWSQIQRAARRGTIRL